MNHPKVGIIMVYLCTAERKPHNGVVRLFQKVSCLPTYFFYLSTLSICWGNWWQNLIALGVFVWEIWGLNYFSVGQFLSLYIYPFTRLHLMRYPLSRLLSSSRLNTPYTDLILGIFAIHMNILCQKIIEFIPTSEEIRGINDREID